MDNFPQPPKINIDPDLLREVGFTLSGETRFKDTIQDYSNTLFKKSVHFGELDKASDAPREITHEHVKAAAFSIAQSYGKDRPSKLQHFAQACEYISTAISGAGASHLDKTAGVIAFVLGAIGAVLLFVYRVTSNRDN